MADYQEMYLTLVRATEESINTLIRAQQKCEALYISSAEPDLSVPPAQDQSAE